MSGKNRFHLTAIESLFFASFFLVVSAASSNEKTFEGYCELENRLAKNLTSVLEIRLQQMLAEFESNLTSKLLPRLVDQAIQANARNDKRREAVKAMARSAWRAFIDDQQNRQNSTPLEEPNYWWVGRNVLSALSTLHLMQLKEEFAEGRRWVEQKLKEEDRFATFNQSLRMEEITWEYLGGLLSLYALTDGDKLYLEQAAKVLKAIQPVYNTATQMPYAKINPSTGEPWDEDPHLAAAAGDYLEAVYLGDLLETTGPKGSGKQVKSRAQAARKRLVQMLIANGTAGYYEDVLDVQKATFTYQITGLNSWTGGFYRSLLGSTIQSAGRDVEGLRLYTEAMETFIKGRVIRSNDSTGLGLVIDKNTKFEYATQEFKYEYLMRYHACFVGGMLTLGAREIEKEALKNASSTIFTLEIATRHRKLGSQIAETCHQASNRTTTKLGPSQFNHEDGLQRFKYWGYSLSPELAETNFILWRLTGDVKYRERAWEMAQGIEKYCKNPNGGYEPIRNVDDQNGGGFNKIEDQQTPIFLSATLKYLYLTFAPTDALPLDKWVFNEVGHPLPVCGQHSEKIYPKHFCA